MLDCVNLAEARKSHSDVGASFDGQVLGIKNKASYSYNRPNILFGHFNLRSAIEIGSEQANLAT